MSGYIGNIPTPQATQSRQSFTATASQTTFATVGYTAGFIDVYLNGVHLLDGTDYTATNGSDIVLTTGAALDDVVEFVAYETFSVLDQSFTGTTTVDALVATSVSAGTLVAGTASYGGTADVITITTGLNLSALTTGMEIRFRATAANTGATTINVDGLGAVTALTITGAALPASYIRTDVDTVIRYNGTNWIADRQVERGTNANGDYTRLADGSQTCYYTGTVNKVSLTYPKTYPASFITIPATSGDCISANLDGTHPDARNTSFFYPHAGYGGSGGVSTTQWDFIGKNTTFAVTQAITTSALTMRLSAIGYWY